ncbi:hypothetical protein KR51_00028040 [Rubidibacter lacunae KORDI 51-2]|uniref:Uncharacterized protein n=1 Tax=Rubidibacter lacunae KORDI 51-2 TaxID=582515 RepID=U5D861_9CHRO|nr:hypothetical protein KR51_00028040 [Rubidibacter lacunae KORDI 51-2]
MLGLPLQTTRKHGDRLGKQNYLCKDCNFKFIEFSSSRGYPPVVRKDLRSYFLRVATNAKYWLRNGRPAIAGMRYREVHSNPNAAATGAVR